MKWRDAKTTSEREDALAEALAATDGNVTEAAKLLGIDRRHLHRLLRPAADANPNLVRVSLDLPKAAKDWLERKALERKQRGELPRMAMSPIVVELVEREMARERSAEGLEP